MELSKVFSLLAQNIVLIVIIILIFMTVSGIISVLFIPPKYDAKSTLIVNKDSSDTEYDYSDILLTQSLVNTYSVIIVSNTVLYQVIDNIGLDFSCKDLRNKLIVSGIEDTEIISVSIKDTIPQRAVDIVNEISNVCPSEIIRTANVGSVELIDPAVLPEKPVSPNIQLNIILAGLLGFIIIVLYIIVKEQYDTTVKTQEDIELHLGLHVLGQIPKLY